jgi:hypothetical protein
MRVMTHHHGVMIHHAAIIHHAMVHAGQRAKEEAAMIAATGEKAVPQ